MMMSAGMLLGQSPDAAQAPAGQQPQAGQPAAAPHQVDPDKAARHLGKMLNLNDDQVARIKPIIQDREEQLADVRSDSSLPVQYKRKKTQEIMQDSRSKMEDVMTDQQKQQFEQMQPQRRGPRGMPPQTAPQQEPQAPQQ
jgi:hypothetical protein